MVTDGSLTEHLLNERFDFNNWSQNLIKESPWFGISAALHVLFLLVMGAILVAAPAGERRIDLPDKINITPPKPIEKLKPELPPDLIEHTSIREDNIISEAETVIKEADPSKHNETADEEDDHESKGDDEKFISDKQIKGIDTNDIIGLGPGPGGKHGGPRGGRYNLFAQDSSTNKTIKSSDAGLWWLAQHQNSDGSWGAVSFQNHCKGQRCAGAGQPEFDVGLTGLVLLAFTGSNLTPGSRNTMRGINIGEVVGKAGRYLAHIQKPNGQYGENSMTKFMYNQAIAAYAMVDLYCVMKDKGEPAAIELKDIALKGVQFLIDAQNQGRAWRYQPHSNDNDMSVTGWCVMAIKTAEDAGLLTAPGRVWDGVRTYLDEVTDPNFPYGGGVGYLEKGSFAILPSEKQKFEQGKMYVPPSLTAVGLMTRIFMGQKQTDAVIQGSAKWLVDAHLPKWEPDNYGKIDYYYWFYGSYALNQFDGSKGPVWKKWENELIPTVVKHQKTAKDGSCANGSWDTADRWSAEGGRVYATAINILTLEVYYRQRIVGDKK